MKFIKLIIICLLFIVNKSYCQAIFNSAYNEYLNGDLSKSVELLTKSIEAKEEVAKSYMYRGAAQAFLGKYPEASRDLEISFKLDSLNDKIYFYYGKFYLLKREPERALLCYSQAIERNVSFARAYNERGNAKLMLGDFSGAIKDDSIAISLKPKEQTFYNDRGYAKLKLKKYNEAIGDFNMSLELKVNQKAYTNIGLAYSLMNDHVKAIEYYSNALKITREDSETLYLRGVSFRSLGKLDEACNDFKESKNLGYSAAIQILDEVKCK